jgi:hypothetical protein
MCLGSLNRLPSQWDRGPDLQVSLSRGKNANQEAMIASFHLWQEFKMHCAVSVDGAAVVLPTRLE